VNAKYDFTDLRIRFPIRIAVRFAANRMAIRISVRKENISSTREQIAVRFPIRFPVRIIIQQGKNDFPEIGRQKLNRVQFGAQFVALEPRATILSRKIKLSPI
jgi:hypothetical protein